MNRSSQRVPMSRSRKSGVGPMGRAYTGGGRPIVPLTQCPIDSPCVCVRVGVCVRGVRMRPRERTHAPIPLLSMGHWDIGTRKGSQLNFEEKACQ